MGPAKAAVTIVILAVFAGYLFRSGVFRPIVIENTEKESMTIVYAKAKGSFANILGEYEKLQARLKDILPKEDTKTGVSIFFDNPHEVESSNLRWTVGYRLHTADEGLRQKLAQEEGLFVTAIPSGKGVHCFFPAKTAIAPWIGAMRIYGSLYEKAGVEASPALEIYNEVDGFDNIEYLVYNEPDVIQSLSGLY